MKRTPGGMPYDFIRYTICHWINGERIYIGDYRTLKEARTAFSGDGHRSSGGTIRKHWMYNGRVAFEDVRQ